MSTAAPGSLLDLALAKTGQRVSMDLVQITDRASFERYTQILMSQSSLLMARDGPKQIDESWIEGWVQDDGRLVVIVAIPTLASHQLTVPRLGWNHVTAEYAASVAAKLENVLRQDPGILDTLGARLKNRTVAEAGIDSDSVSAIVLLVDRYPESLRPMTEFIEVRPGIRNLLDQWLESPASSAPYGVLFTAPKWQFVAGIKPFTADTSSNVVAYIGRKLAERGASLGSAVFSASVADDAMSTALHGAWRAAGGMMAAAPLLGR